MSGISGLNAYYAYSGGGAYGGSYGVLAAQRAAQATGKIPAVGAKKGAQPEAPVDRVRPVSPVRAEAAAQVSRPVPTWNLNAAEEAVRLRIQQPGEGAAQAAGLPGSSAEKAALPNLPKSGAAQTAGLPGSGTPQSFGLPGAAQQPAWPSLPGSGAETAGLPGSEKWAGLPSYPGVDAGESATRLRIQYPGDESAQAAGDGKASSGVEGAQKAAEEGRCETCEQRKYQDGSDDPGVSYQTPTRISPENAASAVRGHEMEHVVREQAKANREDRRVVSQSVTLHTDICPECGKAYISGGTTRTVTASKPAEPAPAKQAEEPKAPSGLQ